jgi:chromate transport protein ChrA
MENYMQNNVANLSRLNMSDTMSSNRGSSSSSSSSSSGRLGSIPLPVIVLVVLHLAKKMIPEELRKTVANPMVAGGVAVFLFYQNRKNMMMAVLYAALAYYVLSSMASKPKQEAKQ